MYILFVNECELNECEITLSVIVGKVFIKEINKMRTKFLYAIYFLTSKYKI